MSGDAAGYFRSERRILGRDALERRENARGDFRGKGITLANGLADCAGRSTTGRQTRLIRRLRATTITARSSSVARPAAGTLVATRSAVARSGSPVFVRSGGVVKRGLLTSGRLVDVMNLSAGVYATFGIVEFAAVERTVTLAVETALEGRARPAWPRCISSNGLPPRGAPLRSPEGQDRRTICRRGSRSFYRRACGRRTACHRGFRKAYE